MTLYLIGLGLWDEKDITIRGLETVKKCQTVFLETYTSKLSCSRETLEKLYGKKILEADRNLVEKESNKILEPAKTSNVALLVIGDAFSATTHASLLLDAKKMGVRAKTISNASVLTAVGIVGLELYKYGPVTSLPYHEPGYESKTAYEVLAKNQEQGWHTLILLDIKSEQKRYMTVNEAIEILLKIEEKEKKGIFRTTTTVVGCARLGSSTPVIQYGEAGQLMKEEFGEPLHCLIVPGKLHFVEEEMLQEWRIKS
ncbi:MAG: diphthine synthase [Nanoarchaeota archaeon]